MKENKVGKIVLSAIFVLLGAGAISSLTPNEKTSSEETPYTVTYVADGVTVGTDTYTTTDTTVLVPRVPQKEHYTGAWEDVALNGGDKTVNAVYTPIEYTVTYVADGVTVDETSYTVEDAAVTAPNVPTKAWYVGEWEDVALNGGNKTVNAVWTEGEYTVTYVADGATVGTDTYTLSSQEVTAPNVPLKTKFTGEWEDVTLDGFDKTVNVVWTEYEYAITYIVVFENNALLVFDPYDRVRNQFASYEIRMKMIDHSAGDLLTDSRIHSYFISRKKVCSDVYDTAFFGGHYQERQARSKVGGINQTPQYTSLKPTEEQRRWIGSHFYDTVDKIFAKDAA